MISKRKKKSAPAAGLLQNLWQRSLFSPWKGTDSRPRKQIRRKFVQLGYLLSGGDPSDEAALEKIALLAKAIEALHLGSWTAGTFLSFETFDQIRKGPFSEVQKLQIFGAMIETFCQAHRGQALDLSIRIDEVPLSTVREVCMKSLELKSGILMALSLKLGALVAPEAMCLQKISSFGIRFGAVLQMIDDVGSLKVKGRNLKSLEDLILRRPIWIWAVLAEHFPSATMAQFRKAVQSLPQTRELEDLMVQTNFREQALQRTRSELSIVLEKMKNDFQLQNSSKAFRLARELGEKLTQAQ